MVRAVSHQEEFFDKLDIGQVGPEKLIENDQFRLMNKGCDKQLLAYLPAPHFTPLILREDIFQPGSIA
jgi:hypothetical protein